MTDYAQPQAHIYGQHPQAPHMQATYSNGPAVGNQWCLYTNYRLLFCTGMWQPGTHDQKKIAIEVGRRRMGQQGHGKGRKVEQIAFFEEEENTAETTSPLASLPAMESRLNQPPVSSEQCASLNLRTSANATSKNMCPLLIEGESCG